MVVGCYDAPSRNRNRSPVYRCLPSASVGFRQLPPTVLTVHTRSGVRSMWSWVLGLSYAWNGWSEDITACRWLQFVHAPRSFSLHAHQLAGLQYPHLPCVDGDCCALLYSTMSQYSKLPTPRLSMHASSIWRGMCRCRCELLGGSASNSGTCQRTSCHHTMAVQLACPAA